MLFKMNLKFRFKRQDRFPFITKALVFMAVAYFYLFLCWMITFFTLFVDHLPVFAGKVFAGISAQM